MTTYVILSIINDTPVVVGITSDEDDVYTIIAEQELKGRNVKVFKEHKLKPQIWKL